MISTYDLGNTPVSSRIPVYTLYQTCYWSRGMLEHVLLRLADKATHTATR
jgi:hypothetical protein